MKSALRLLDDNLADFVGDVTNTSSELRFDFKLACATSRLMHICSRQIDEAGAYAYRTVRNFTRGAVEVRCGEWLLLQYAGRSLIGCVSEIVELHVKAGSSMLRMWLRQSRDVVFEDETRGQVITVRRDCDHNEQYVCVERASLHEVSCDQSSDTHLTFEYIY